MARLTLAFKLFAPPPSGIEGSAGKAFMMMKAPGDGAFYRELNGPSSDFGADDLLERNSPNLRPIPTLGVRAAFRPFDRVFKNSRVPSRLGEEIASRNRMNSSVGPKALCIQGFKNLGRHHFALRDFTYQANEFVSRRIA